LNECGIGAEEDAKSAKDPDPFKATAVNQHRVLIFCQLKQMLDIVEFDLFKRHMPSVTYMRLDGDVPQAARVPMVEKFNADPSIDVLLLSTKVGGLGLNLTGADVVVFLEHDWNPQNDLQAMDRAHRIGAKKTVNVYRIITKGTLEEKIMRFDKLLAASVDCSAERLTMFSLWLGCSLQQFKLKIANTVVSKDNQSFSSMGTAQLLDLFNYSGDPTKGFQKGSNDAKEGDATESKPGLKAVLSSLEEMWDSAQYAEEFNLDSFVDKLR
jgi:TATA-binding protein-associated factor